MVMAKSHSVVSGLLVLLFSASPIPAKDIRIVCPYAGPIKDVYENKNYQLHLEDQSLLKGVFFQWLNPDRYQWNAFVYQASDINYSTLWGGHFIFDYYTLSSGRGKFVIGTGVECLRIKMDADGHIAPLKNVEVLTNLFIPYARFGYRFQVIDSKCKMSILPWMGAEYERTRGDIALVVDPPGPAPSVTREEKLRDDRRLGLAGLNFNATLFHMLDLEAKVHRAFDAKVHYTTATAMVNIFLTRRFGLSYRVKYMELQKGSDLYNIFGIAFVF
jgi:hypothetical protein